MSLLRTWSKGVRARLLAVSVLPIFALGFLSFTSYKGLTDIGTMLSDSYRVVIPTFDSIKQMITQRVNMGYFALQALDRADKPADRKSSVEKFAAAYEAYNKAQTYYESTEFFPEEEKNYEVIKNNKVKFSELNQKILAKLKEGTPEADKEVRAQFAEGSEWLVMGRDVRVVLEKT